MKKLVSIVTIAVLAISSLTFSGCAKGEEDPFFSIHTRDARLTQAWNMVSMTGTVVTTVDGLTTNVEYEFDGTNLYITTDGVTESFAYIFNMEVKDNGELFSEEFLNNTVTGATIAQSSKTSYWYWGDDNQSKTSVNLDLTGVLAAWLNYDLPRLAYNERMMSVDYADNYTVYDPVSETYSAASESVLLEVKFDVDLTQ
ncbi:MAG: hypothetical protein IPO47_16355 [Bacteroidetes bacterium]|nr:hypothetical protein [Bacteroidota bacterium]